MPTEWSIRVEAERRAGKLVLAHFGSIYPKKQSDSVLDIAAELKRRGTAIFVIFVGSFIKGTDQVEKLFYDKAAALCLTEDVAVTGYIETDAELFGILDTVDVFVYSFKEGLTSRRSSVLACLQTGRPIVVNAPAVADEYEHRVYQQAIETGVLTLVPTYARITEYANAIKSARKHVRGAPLVLYELNWREAAQSLASAFDGGRRVGTGERPALASAGVMRSTEQVGATRPIRQASLAGEKGLEDSVIKH